MGEFNFRLPADWDSCRAASRSIHMIGNDGFPSPCRVSVTESILSLIRNEERSGKLFICCPFAEFGTMLVRTGSLLPRSEPYSLLIELARGTLFRLRNQFSIWQVGGLKIPDAIEQLQLDASLLLGAAIRHPDETGSDAAARESLDLAMRAIFAISRVFGDQISRVRIEHPNLPVFWTAFAQGSDKDQQPTANIAHWSDWKQMTKDHELPIGERSIEGPWVDASVGGLSEPLSTGDFATRLDTMKSIFSERLSSIDSKTPFIHVAAGLNGMGHRHLSYPQQLQAMETLLEIVDTANQTIPAMVSFDFPWAERLASAVGGIHPLQIADTLLQQGSPIQLIGLDINLDWWPGGSTLRDPLQWIDLIDLWTQFGLPLVICLRVPNNVDAPDDQPAASGSTRNTVRGGMTSDQQSTLLKTVLPMLIARPAVQGVIFRQRNDGDDLRFPAGGFINPDQEIGQPLATATEVFRSLV